ncbi:hypothetical protein, partial [Staphylococcus haemolyticus]|uniref:hypothetical protein n=1 Tax=Staphylococcus haemolyticus TaxID=1283 RepID=UPI001C720C81
EMNIASVKMHGVWCSESSDRYVKEQVATIRRDLLSVKTHTANNTRKEASAATDVYKILH